MVNKSKKHILVALVCCGLAASSIGISINSSGVFYTPVSDSLNILRGSFSMHMTIFSLVTAISAFFIPKLMEKFSYKLILTISVIAAVLATGAMALAKSIPMFYLLGAIRGLATSFFSIVPLTLIINQWFEKNHGLVTSIVFGFSGLAGSICSPILSHFIETFGWQTGYLIKAGVILCLCLPAIIYPFHLDPRDDGYLPYGYVEKNITQTKTTLNFRFITIAFICFFIFSLFCSCITSFTQHFPGYGKSLGYSSSLSALLLSAGMIGNVVFKLVIGALSDWLGAMKATVMMIFAVMIGIVLLIIGNSNIYLLLIGAFLFGSSYALGAVSLPLLTKYFFQVENYAKAFPSVSFASNLGAAVSLSMVGYIYDFFGSYVYGFIIAFIMISVGIVLLAVTNHQQKSAKKM